MLKHSQNGLAARLDAHYLKIAAFVITLRCWRTYSMLSKISSNFKAKRRANPQQKSISVKPTLTGLFSLKSLPSRAEETMGSF